MAYGAGTNTENNTATGNNNVDALIANRRWESNNVRFSFTSNFANDYEDELGYPDSATHAASFSTLNNIQRAVMREWTEMFEDVSNLNLIELGGAGDRDATIRIAESDDPGTAYAYLPGGSFAAGDIWFNKDDYNSPAIGNYAYHTFGHELGHALGLEHGHEANGVAGVAMDANRDSMEFSIMTYRSYEGDPISGGYSNETWGYAQSLMMYDIRAIQEMYGADFNTNSGNTVYSFSTTTGEMSINGVGQGTPGGNRVFRTIWDGNGIDTYSFTNYTTDLSIDLRPGSWSNLDTNGNFQTANLGDGNFARGHVFNALPYYGDNRSLIERAYGGSGDDSIKGNSAQNFLYGGDGDDTLVGSAGRDTLAGRNDNDLIRSDGDGGLYYGDAGNDLMFSGLGGETMDGGLGYDVINHTAFNGNYEFNMASGETNFGGESFVNFEQAIMGNGNDEVTGNASDNVIFGREGNDTLVGGAGRDSLYGGNDSDEIRSDGDGGFYDGGSGNDCMFSGLGGETMDGGSGIDIIDHTAYNGNYEFDMASGETNFANESFVNFEYAIMGNGNDEVTGNASNNYIFGDEGNDTLVGGAGRDSLVGGSDNDEIHSDGDGGVYSGGSGRDRMFSGLGGETMDGGSGVDTIDHTAFNGNYEFDMASGETNFANESFINFEYAVMGNGNDKVTGTNVGNIINTGGGNDVIEAAKGNDLVDAGSGDDVLLGFASYDDIEIDWLTGGAGEDRFIVGNSHGNGYNNAGNSDYALVTDFEDGDTISLDLRDSHGNHDYSFGSSPIDSISGTGIFDESDDLLALVAGVSSSDLTLSPQSYTVNVEYV